MRSEHKQPHRSRKKTCMGIQSPEHSLHRNRHRSTKPAVEKTTPGGSVPDSINVCAASLDIVHRKKRKDSSKGVLSFSFFTKIISNLEIHPQAGQFLIPSMFALPVFTLSIEKKERTVARAYCPFFFYQNYQ